MTVQTSAFWVTTTRRTWWRSCSPWWPEIGKRPRSEITWLQCQTWVLETYQCVCVWRLCSGPRKLCKVCFGYNERAQWGQREAWSGLEHLLPLQRHLSVAASQQESAGLVRGGVCSPAHENLTWLSTLVFFHRGVLQLFQCKNRVPPWVFQKSGRTLGVDWYINNQ